MDENLQTMYVKYLNTWWVKIELRLNELAIVSFPGTTIPKTIVEVKDLT